VLDHNYILSGHKLETVLILKKVSPKILILLDRLKIDGICGLSNGDEKKEMDSRQSIIGHISRVLEIIQMHSLESRAWSLDPWLKS
jgi:hypothetical protein